MKNLVKILGLIVCVCFVISGCVLIQGVGVWAAITEIDNSILSVENENFEQESGIDLTVVKRGLWSMQSTFNNKMINTYYKALLDNQLVYSINMTQAEYAKQTKTANNISIIINNSYFQDFTEFENALMLVASTSTLSLLQDNVSNKNDAKKLFFDIFDKYEHRDISNIRNAQWFKDKNISITDNGIIINQ